MIPIPDEHPLRRLFRGLVDHVFCSEIGVCDPEMTNYIADLMVNFVHVDAIQAMKTGPAEKPAEVVDMLESVQHNGLADPGGREVRVYQHIGDYALFWSGVYPECLRRRGGVYGKDQMIDYVSQGKRSYAIASELSLDDEGPTSALFRRLSHEFELCCHGLGLVRKGWQESAPNDQDGSTGLLY